MTESLGPGWAPKKPPPSGDGEPAPKPKRLWWRFTLASILIVAVSAAATATSVLLYLDSIAHALSHNNVLNNKLKKALAEVEPGAPENILILGSDKRAGEEFEEDPGRSDTTILLRLDPEDETISVMSIPRDLKVEIPGYGTGKFNEAYSYGGPKMTLQVVKELTGLRINHVVNVDFLGFVRAVDAIGCVYTDVDRRYYHSNVGLPPSEQYSEINIQPGYQKLCGVKALQYVRFRHTDTDIVRSARQQAFISDARQRVSLQDLVFDQSGLIDIFTKYTTSDINSKETMLEVLKLFIASRNAPIKQVHFPAELGPSYVYSNETWIHEAVKEFLTGESFGNESSESSASSSSAKKKGGKKGKSGKSHQKKKHEKPKPKVEVAKPGNDGLVPARETGEAEAEAAARKVGPGFPIFYPTRLPPEAHFVETDPYEHVVDPRVYRFKDDSGTRHAAYKMVAVIEEPDGYHYFGVQGIQGWEDPPILANPSVTETIHGRDYEIFVDSGAIKLIAWHRGSNTYWIANDLERSLSNEQMVGMARSADVTMGKKKPKKAGKRP
ncbi:MAG TPA: LCP family protein [Solirubrobacterales bacterium]|nr:LCP family protein [Solirubrobacterales bacterium]